MIEINKSKSQAINLEDDGWEEDHVEAYLTRFNQKSASADDRSENDEDESENSDQLSSSHIISQSGTEKEDKSKSGKYSEVSEVSNDTESEQ